MQLCRSLLVLVVFMAAEEVATQFLQPQAVIQHLELLLRSVVATAELMPVIQVMVVLAVAEDSTIRVKEFRSELSAREIQVVGQTAVVTELAAVAVVQVLSVPMRLRYILVALEVSEFRR
jgi:hypothetical protein